MFTKFTSAVALHHHGSLIKKSGTKHWIVQAPFTWYLTYIKFSEEETIMENRITVGGGFKTDFGSIPRVFWTVFNPTEYVAYVLHDYLYEMHGMYINEHGQIKKVSRRIADKALRQALIAEGCNTVSAWIQWLAVRLFGWIPWINK